MATEITCWSDLFTAETELLMKRKEAKDKLFEFLRKKPCKSDRLWERTCAHLQRELNQACDELNELRERYGSCW